MSINQNPQFQPQYVRPLPPTIATTVVITLLFGIFGIIPAASNASKAQQLGYPSGKYWGAFFAVMLAWIFLAVAVSAGCLMSTYLENFDDHTTVDVVREGSQFHLSMRQPGTFARISFADGQCGPTTVSRLAQDLSRAVINSDYAEDVITDVVKAAIRAGHRTTVEAAVHNTLAEMHASAS